MSEEESRSELYTRHQGLFDARFLDILFKTFVGLERHIFEKLADNDPLAPSQAEYSLTWYGEEAEEVMEAVWNGTLKLPGCPEGYWDDGSPIGDEPTTEEF